MKNLPSKNNSSVTNINTTTTSDINTINNQRQVVESNNNSSLSSQQQRQQSLFEIALDEGEEIIKEIEIPEISSSNLVSISSSSSLDIPLTPPSVVNELSKNNIFENNKRLALSIHTNKASRGNNNKPAFSAYQQAMSEFYETIDPGSSNDDGLGSWSMNYFSNSTSTSGDCNRRKRMGGVTAAAAITTQAVTQEKSGQLGVSGPRRKTEDTMDVCSPTSTNNSINDSSSLISTMNSMPTAMEDLEEGCAVKQPIHEPQMPDVTYEEIYGDAYVGGPIRYIYPSGYQNMRPRGTPWKLSIVVFSLFTWMSVFIVDHCSDQVDVTNSYYQEGNMDDDTIRIATGWCGSRMLYFMWVVSVIITALAAAYCSIIGYIKLRDFAVANSRSQPPGIIGRSDYYVRIDEHRQHLPDTDPLNQNATNKNKIYQSDGTPQFWGGHIYRPTQAACAVTSR